MLSLGKNQRNLLVYISFVVTMGVFNAGALLRNGRIWAFNHWAFWSYPLLLALSIGLILYAGFLFRKEDEKPGRKQQSTDNGKKHYKYRNQVLTVAVISGLAFFFLRTQLHFLGDGYNLLSGLSSDTPIIKPRNYMGTMPQYWIYRLLDGSGWKDALLSYRIISFTAGLISLVILAVGINSLFRKLQDRLLAFLAVLSAGTTFLYLGYVENYALLNTIILAVCLVGMLGAENKISRLWIIPLVIGSLFFHYFGVAMIPAAVYLLLCDTRLGIRISRMRKNIKAAVAAIVLALVIVSFIWLYRDSYTFRFALVPILPDRFTLEGYTLFSSKHIIDYINLIFVLMPGILIAVVGLLAWNFNLRGPKQRTVFLLIATITTLGLVFVIDPRLGMARDWDLFAFAGLPLTLLAVDIFLRGQSSGSSGRLTLKMMIITGVFVLASRAATLMDPAAAIGHLDNNIRQDPLKYSNVVFPLKQYVEWGGDRSLVDGMVSAYKERFPGIVEAESMKNYNAGNFVEAARGFEQQIKSNPQKTFAYGYLAKCRMQAGLYDSAITLLEIAHGLENYNLSILDDLGSCYAIRGDFNKARKFLMKSLSLEKDHIPALAKLAALYISVGDIEKSSEYYQRLCGRPEASSLYFLAIGKDYEANGYSRQALIAYREAIKRGLPKEAEIELRSRRPELIN